MSKLNWFLFIATLAILSLAVLVYFKIIALPTGESINTFITALKSGDFNSISTAFFAMIGVTGVSLGGLGALAYLYTKLKGTYQSTVTQAKSLIAEKNSIVESKTTELTKLSQTQQSIIAEKEKLAQTATEAKTRLTTVQANYDSVVAKKASVENQYDSLKKAYDKASAQLEVLKPKVM